MKKIVLDFSEAVARAPPSLSRTYNFIEESGTLFSGLIYFPFSKGDQVINAFHIAIF